MSADLLTTLAPAGFSRSRPAWLHGDISIFAYFLSKLLKGSSAISYHTRQKKKK
jgi:hypothetical protein